MESSKAPVACPSCGQSVLVPTTDLRSFFRCPRCGNESVIANVISKETPLEAVAVRPFSDERLVATAGPPGAITLYAQPALPAAAALQDALRLPDATSLHAPAAGSPARAGAPAPTPVVPSVTPISSGGPADPVRSPRPSEVAGRFAARAFEAGSRGAARLGRFGSWLQRVAGGIDAALYGGRKWAVFAAALLATVAPLVDRALGNNLFWTALTTFLFVALVSVLVFARIGSLRDEDGSWSQAVAVHRLSQWWAELREIFGSSEQGADPGARKVSIGRLAVFVALSVLAARNVPLLTALIGQELFDLQLDLNETIANSMLAVGALLVAFGAASWWFGKRDLRESRRRLGVAAEVSGAEVSEAVAGLDAVVDCTQRAEVERLVNRKPHPVIVELLGAFASWRPRDCYREDDYQASLHRHLRRKMAWAEPERECPIGERSEGTNGRADLIVAGTIVLELKRGLSKSTSQKALGQVEMYARGWKNGPVILVVCDADRGAATGFLGQAMADLAQRAPVMMIIAGRPARA